MVAGARLLEPLEVLGQLVLGRERGAVDAREHLAVRVAAPVGAGDARELERLRAAGAGRVRAAAEVVEVAVLVDADRRHALVLDQVLDQLDLVRLVLAQEVLDRLAHRQLGAHERLVGLHVLLHLRFDLREVALVEGDAGRELEVVVEAVGDRRADRHLRARIELEHGLREHVRDVVAQQLQRVAVAGLGGDDLDRLAVGQRQREVDDPAVVVGRAVPLLRLALVEDTDGHRGPGEARTDVGGEIGSGGAVGKFTDGAVGKGDAHRALRLDHGHAHALRRPWRRRRRRASA